MEGQQPVLAVDYYKGKISAAGKFDWEYVKQVYNEIYYKQNTLPPQIYTLNKIKFFKYYSPELDKFLKDNKLLLDDPIEIPSSALTEINNIQKSLCKTRQQLETLLNGGKVEATKPKKGKDVPKKVKEVPQKSVDVVINLPQPTSTNPFDRYVQLTLHHLMAIKHLTEDKAMEELKNDWDQMTEDERGDFLEI